MLYRYMSGDFRLQNLNCKEFLFSLFFSFCFVCIEKDFKALSLVKSKQDLMFKIRETIVLNA